MLVGKDLRVSIWHHLAGSDPQVLTPHLKALVDLAIEGKHTHQKTLTKTAVKQIRSKVGARTGEPRLTAELPDYIKGSGMPGDPHFVEYPVFFLELQPLPEPPAPVVVDYSSYTKAELYDIGTGRGLEIRTRMTKSEMIALLEADD